MTVRTRPRGVAQIETGVRLQSEKLAAAKLRIAELDSPSQDLVPDLTALHAALEELRVHQEELAVAPLRSTSSVE